MNGFLVLSIHGLDDIPVHMFLTREEAVTFASSMDPATENPLVTWDNSGAICAKVLEFRNGLPIGPAEIIDFAETIETV